MADLVKDTPFDDVATRGAEIYARIKTRFEPQQNGKFLAIEPDSESTYLGTSGAEALEKARSEKNGKLFYLVKVGFDSAETLAYSVLGHR